MRRLELLNGTLKTPAQIEELVAHPELDSMFQALWNIYLRKADATTSVAYWSDRFDDNKAFNTALYHLSKSGWIITNIIPARNWGTIQLDSRKLLKWVSADELLDIRKEYKFKQYRMILDTASKDLGDVELQRPGTAKCGTHKFKYDTKYLTKYYDYIVLNVAKGIQKAIDKHHLDLDGTDYKSLSEEILQFHMYSPDLDFSMGGAKKDSRGRAVSSGLSRVFNPIGYKDARALLVGPSTSLGISGKTQVYLFIAELLGYKPSTIEEKTELGKTAYKERIYHDLDLFKEDDRADLHENIWLERIYDNLDTYDGTNWTVPIELDATASMIQIEGTLLNDYNMLNETNVVNPTHLQDVWSKEGIPRKAFKAVATPTLYGSSKSPLDLWKSKKIKYTSSQLIAMEHELDNGILGLSNDFKDFIISNVEPTPEMRVHIWNEEFTVSCNRFRNLGDYMKKYPAYDTSLDTVLTINHTHTKRIPDLEQFRRYFVTLLVHNLDSQVADRVAGQLDWCLPIYDAFIVMPIDGMKTRNLYANMLSFIHTDRKEILQNYFNSIGIPINKDTQAQWTKLVRKIEPITDFKPSYTALK